MGKFGKWVKKAAKNVGGVIEDAAQDVADVGKDVGTGVAVLASQPVNSVTGHDYNPEWETKVGAGLMAGPILNSDWSNIAAKNFADALTDERATDFFNKFRKEENKETAFGGYTENKSRYKDFGILGKIESGSKKVAAVAGVLYGENAQKQMNDELGFNPQDFLPPIGQEGLVPTSGDGYGDFPGATGMGFLILVIIYFLFSKN